MHLFIENKHGAKGERKAEPQGPPASKWQTQSKELGEGRSLAEAVRGEAGGNKSSGLNMQNISEESS